MSHYIKTLIDTLPIFLAQGGYWIIALIVILEGIPIIGSLLPGHVMIVAAGFLAKVGILSLPMVLVIATIAAFVGDIIGFLVGKKYGYSFLKKFGKYFYIKEEHIEKAKKLTLEHTGKTLIFGKFSPLTRPLAPFIVGASGVKVSTFAIFNVVGAILWIFVSVMIGYAFGAGYYGATVVFGKVIVFAIIFTILIIWGYRFVNIRFHIFKKYELFVLALNLVSLWGLTKTIQDAFSTHSFMENFDIWVNLFMREHVGPFLIIISTWVTNIGSTGVMIILGIIIGLWFMWKKKWRRGAIMLLSIVSTSVILIILKNIIMRPRPINAIHLLSDPSFPSGHAGLSAAFFLVIAYILVPCIHSWIKREIVIVICVLTPFIIGLSRLTLNVHWASDVIAGWSLGIFLATGSILLVRYVGALFLPSNDKK